MTRSRLAALPALTALMLCAVTREASADEKPDSRPIRVRVHLEREGEVADVFVHRRDEWTFACRAPCSFDAAPSERLRIDVLGGNDEPVTTTVPSDAVGTHDIHVGHRGRGALIGGLAAFAGGAISLALGMAILRGAGDDDLFGDANRFVGRLGLVLGGAAGITGAGLIVFRSTAPVIVPSPPPAAPSTAGQLPPLPARFV